MAGTTISGSYTTSVTLSTPATQNPATISGTGRINVTATSGSALYGTNAAVWAVYNYGTLIGPARGVFLTAGGTVTNESGGLISGGNRGVDITGAVGAVTNAGSIAGGTQQGVRLTGGGSVTNTSGGQISAGGIYGAIYIRQGGTVSNAAGATITGRVQIYDSAGTVINGGAINAQNSSADGVQLFAGGSVTNAAGATITGPVQIYASAGTVINDGAINSQHSSAEGVQLFAGGSLTNAANGTIIGGVYLPVGTLSNAGLIGGIQAGALGSVVITNVSGGVLQGIVGGTSPAITVSNAGMIVGSAIGISLQNTGTVINAAGGSIKGNQFGVYLKARASLSNSGSIFGSHSAVQITGASQVTNSAGGILQSASYLGNALVFRSGPGTLNNAGTIAGGNGVIFRQGGAIINQAGGTIFGSGIGINPKGGPYHPIQLKGEGTIVNDGTINGYGRILMAAGGSVTNSADGLITAIDMNGSSDAITNSGMFTGGVHITGDGTVNNESGGTIVDRISMSSAGSLANAGSIDGIYMGAGTVTNAGSIGHVSVGAGTVSNAGSIGGIAMDTGTIVNDGVISGVTFLDGPALLVVDPGAQFNGTINGGITASTLELGVGSGTLPGFGTTIVNFASITFDAGAAWTIAGNTAGLSGVISGFAQADTIDLTGLTETVQNYTAGTLTLVGDKTITLHLPGAFTTASFQTAPDAGTGTDVFLVCFAAGTRIMTDRGEVAVEALKVGETVLTQRGDARPIVWIGTGQVLATPGRRTGNTPVIVRKGALADAVPLRNMRLTKGHSLFLDGVLIPVEHLVNHRSILWDEYAREVTIYHIELETHDVLIADGAPAESYRDDGNRWQFRNANLGWCLPPQPACAPVLTGGPIVDAVWRRLVDRIASRNGPPLTHEPDVHLLVDGKRIDAIRRSDSEYAFRFTATPRNVRIRSRAAVPQEIGIERDERALGVALRRIVLAQPLRQRTIDANDTSLTDGFYEFEADHAFRWTTGDAAIPAELFAGAHGPCILMVQLGATAQYIDEGNQLTERVA